MHPLPRSPPGPNCSLAFPLADVRPPPWVTRSPPSGDRESELVSIIGAGAIGGMLDVGIQFGSWELGGAEAVDVLLRGPEIILSDNELFPSTIGAANKDAAS